MNELTVRPALLSDLDVLRKFEQAMIEAERPFDSAIRTGDDVRYYDLERLIESPYTHIVVAEWEGKTIGSGYARIESSKSYFRHRKHSYLGFMYVVSEYRGKGINKWILEALETWSVAQGIGEMRLEVYLENTAAIKAYEKSGYAGLVLEMRKRLADN